MSDAATAFNPGATELETSAAALSDFLREPLAEDLETVPGIGPANKRSLVADHVETTFQLLGKFLSFAGPGISGQDLGDRFVAYLKSVGINAKRHLITASIGGKVNAMSPGVFPLA